MLDPIKVLQDLRSKILEDRPFDVDAFYVLCNAIKYLLGCRTRTSSVDRVFYRG